MKTWAGKLGDRFDVVVVGSGGPALTAALAASDLGATVAVLEKSAYFGGTTAMSGGMLWIPLNEHMAEHGIDDDRERALVYLRALILGRTADSVLETVVDRGPEMLQFIESASPVQFASLANFPDYHPEWEGGAMGGRSVEPVPCAVELIGDLAPSVRSMNQLQASTFIQLEAWRSSRTPLVEHGPDTLVRGRALIGPLLQGCAEHGATLVTEIAVRKLVTDGSRVTGVLTDEGETIHAGAGVILACGGFEWSKEMTRSFLSGPVQGSCSPPHNTGDGITMAAKVGARLGNMQEAWWQPQITLPDDLTDGAPRSRSFERTAPGTIIVNRAGKRFVNEAHNYNDMMKVFHLLDPTSYTYVNLPAYLIFDQDHLERYGFMHHTADEPTPSWLASAPTLAELAGQIEIDGTELVRTVERFNEHARHGKDPDFHRGESAYERYWGDGLAPHAAIGPLESPPYYAVEVISGVIGTKGGIVTTEGGQAVDSFGEPIAGLYAAGNTSAHPMGPGYPGGGGTLGPGMTQAFLAGRHCVGAASLAIAP